MVQIYFLNCLSSFVFFFKSSKVNASHNVTVYLSVFLTKPDSVSSRALKNNQIVGWQAPKSEERIVIEPPYSNKWCLRAADAGDSALSQ